MSFGNHYRDRYHGYRRSYRYGYASYRPPYFSYYGPYSYYGPSYSYYGPSYYDPYYRDFSIFDLAYRPSVQPVYVENVVYQQAPQAAPTSENATYYAAPAQTQATAAPDGTEQTSTTGTERDDTYWIEVGITALKTGRYADARSLFMRAVLADEDDGFARMFFALANFSAGDYRAAAGSLRRGLKATPELIDNPIDLRSFYPDDGTLDKQIAKLAELVGNQPSGREARFLLGYLYYATAKPDEASATLQPLTEPGLDDTLATFLRDAALRNGRAEAKEPN